MGFAGLVSLQMLRGAANCVKCDTFKFQCRTPVFEDYLAIPISADFPFLEAETALQNIHWELLDCMLEVRHEDRAVFNIGAV